MIKVKWGVSIESGEESIGFDELNVSDQEEWDSLDSDEQEERLQTALDDLPERVSIIVEDWD